MKTNKKWSQKKRAAKLRIESSRFESQLKRKHKAYENGSGHGFIDPENLLSKFSIVAEKNTEGHLEIQLPEVIDLRKSYKELCGVIKLIRLHGLRDKKPICFSFNSVKEISPSALLFLAAEIHRCRRILGNQKITGRYPADKKIETILEDFGFFRLLGVRSRNKSKNNKYPMEYVDFVSHIKEVKGTVRKFRESLLGTSIVMSGAAKGRLYRALTEAMLNVRHHAYPAGSYKTNPEKGRWWLSGHVNKRTGDLVIMFCDLGVGIPTTLPKIYPMEKIRQCLSLLPTINPPDGDMIKAAMELGRTRTLLENRGRGLNDLRSIINQANAGQLEIFSRMGYYLYNHDGKEVVKNYDTNLGGTLITWTVPLATITNWQQEYHSDHD